MPSTGRSTTKGASGVAASLGVPRRRAYEAALRVRGADGAGAGTSGRA